MATAHIRPTSPETLTHSVATTPCKQRPAGGTGSTGITSKQRMSVIDNSLITVTTGPFLARTCQPCEPAPTVAQTWAVTAPPRCSVQPAKAAQPCRRDRPTLRHNTEQRASPASAPPPATATRSTGGSPRASSRPRAGRCPWHCTEGRYQLTGGESTIVCSCVCRLREHPQAVGQPRAGVRGCREPSRPAATP